MENKKQSNNGATSALIVIREAILEKVAEDSVHRNYLYSHFRRSGLTSATVDFVLDHMLDVGDVVDRGGLIARPKRGYKNVTSDQVAEILRLYHEEGLGEHRIARRLGLKRTTVGRYIRKNVPPEQRRPRVFREGRIKEEV